MKRIDVLGRLPVVFGLSRVEAAAAIGVGATTFDAMVSRGTMPQPRCITPKRFVWDVDELRAAFKALPHAQEQPANPWGEVLSDEPPPPADGRQIKARAPRRSTRDEENAKAVLEMRDQWRRDRAEGKPPTKFEVQMHGATVVWPPDDAQDDWFATIESVFL